MPSPNGRLPDWTRLALCGLLLLLLPLPGPMYSFSGSEADVAALSRVYGPPDGGPLAHGPSLYALPAGWILMAACVLLAISAFPAAPRILRRVPAAKQVLLTGTAMLVATAMTPVESLMHAYLDVGGTFSLQVGRGMYVIYGLVVMAIGCMVSIFSRRANTAA